MAAEFEPHTPTHRTHTVHGPRAAGRRRGTGQHLFNGAHVRSVRWYVVQQVPLPLIPAFFATAGLTSLAVHAGILRYPFERNTDKVATLRESGARSYRTDEIGPQWKRSEREFRHATDCLSGLYPEKDYLIRISFTSDECSDRRGFPRGCNFCRKEGRIFRVTSSRR